MNGIDYIPGIDRAAIVTQGTEHKIAKILYIGNTYNKRPYYFNHETAENLFDPYYDEN